jgi:hypothetical protein
MTSATHVPTATAEEAAPTLGRDVHERVRHWLSGQGITKRVCTRVAVLTAGLLTAETVGRGELTAAVARLQLSKATEASISRRLDPEDLLPVAARALTPTLLATVVADHDRAPAAAHPTW